jgi:hypothetical protein
MPIWQVIPENETMWLVVHIPKSRYNKNKKTRMGKKEKGKVAPN